jgi:hypothetical protein
MPQIPHDSESISLEERVANLEKAYAPNEKLATCVSNLEKSIKEGHFCKWNTEIGRFEQFRHDTSQYRDFVNSKLDEHSKDINQLHTIATELKTGTEILERVETRQKKYKKNIELDRRQNRRSVLLAVGIVILGFVFNVVLEIIRGNIN